MAHVLPPALTTISVKNLSGQVLHLIDGNNSFLIPAGEITIPTLSSNLVFTRMDDNSTFTVVPATSHTSISVGHNHAGIAPSNAMRETFYDGMLWGLALMVCGLGLRMVKQLGCHTGEW